MAKSEKVQDLVIEILGMYKQMKAEKPEDRVTLTVQESVTATFALRYLVTFAKAAPPIRHIYEK